MSDSGFRSFQDFYPFYLSEHRNRTGRRLHFIGSSLSLLLIATGIVEGAWAWYVAALICGYAFAWVGHFFFEKNRPATFRYPLYSFAGDWRMWWETLIGKRAF